jgi:hypothetical protein
MPQVVVGRAEQVLAVVGVAGVLVGVVLCATLAVRNEVS